jgi:hypothetical protein
MFLFFGGTGVLNAFQKEDPDTGGETPPESQKISKYKPEKCRAHNLNLNQRMHQKEKKD